MRNLSLDNFKLLWADIEDGGANNRPNQRKGKANTVAGSEQRSDLTPSMTCEPRLLLCEEYRVRDPSLLIARERLAAMCLLHPQKRTYESAIVMSTLCH